MGRFYQTEAGRFVDNKMFEAPHELMAQVIQGKDKAIDTEITSAQAYLDKLKAEVLKQDSPELQQEIKNYEGKISDVVNNIKLDPLNYKKYSGDITQLGRDINANWTTGKVGTMQQNKKRYDAEIEKLDAYLKANPKNAEYVDLKKKEITQGYQQGLQWNPETGKAGADLKTDMTYYDTNFDDKFIGQMKAKGYAMEKDTVSGQWINTKAVDNKTLTPAEIQKAYLAAVKADPEYQTALQDWKQTGVAGYEDVSPDNVYVPKTNKKGEVQVDKHGDPIMEINKDNLIAKKMIAAGLIYEQRETSSKSTKQANSNYWASLEWDSKQAQASVDGLTGITKEIALKTQQDLNLFNAEFGVALDDMATKSHFPANGKRTYRNIVNHVNEMYKLHPTDPALKQMKQNLSDLQSTYRTRVTIGYVPFSRAFGMNASAAIQKDVDYYAKDPRNLYGLKQDFEIISKDGRKNVYHGRTFQEILNNPTKFGLKPSDLAPELNQAETTPDDNTGEKSTAEELKELDTPKAKAGKTPVYYIENSAMPVLLSDKPEQWDKNKVSTDYEINGIRIRGLANFKEMGLNKRETQTK